MTITIPGQIIKMDTETGIDPVWYAKLQAIFDEVNILIGPTGSGTSLTASLSADVILNASGSYFTGPSIAQGTSGTWWVSGSVTVYDTAGPAVFIAKLWDGTTVIDSGFSNTPVASGAAVFSFSGFIVNPAGNLRISVRDATTINGRISGNPATSGNAKDSTISAFRIA